MTKVKPDSSTSGFVQAMPRDRASLTATIIVAVVADGLRALLCGDPSEPSDVRGYVEGLLRDEFDDVKREAAGERIAGLD